jgi:hypothetical protein
MDNTDLSDLKQLLTRWLRWYRLRRGLDWTGYGLLAGLFLGLTAGFLAASQHWLLRSEFFLLVACTALVSVILAFASGVAWPTPTPQAARVFDRAFNLHERLSTALEFSQSEPRSLASPDLVSLQLSDTLHHAHQIDLHRALPLRLRRTYLLLSSLLVLGVLLIGWRGAPLFTLTAHQRQVEQAIAEQIAQIETLQSNILNNEHLTPQTQQELLQILEDASLRLDQADTAEEAVSILAETQHTLLDISDPQAQSHSQALQSVGTSLTQQANSPLAAVGQQLAAGEFASAAESLASFDPSTLSSDQRQALSEQLSEAAQALQSTAPELSANLSQAAEALQAGDDQAAQQALAQASQSLQQSAQQIAQSQAAAQAASQLSSSQQQMLQAAQGDGSLSTQSGPGSSSQAAQGAASSGAGRGEGDSGDVIGLEAGDDPISQNNAPGDGGESPYQPLYPPDRLAGSSDNLVTLPSSAETGELILGQGDTAPGAQSLTTVPYTQVYAYYAQVYRQAIENGEIPRSLRILVRDYFTSLEP